MRFRDLLCNPEGCPVAVQCFAGNVADPDTLASQVASLRVRYGLQPVAVVGDRGMIDQTRVEADWEPAGCDWITALRHDTMRWLADRKVIQPSLFDRHGFASVTAPDFPGERLLVCYNPLVADERRRKRDALLDATERAVREQAAADAAGTVDRDECNRRLGGLRRCKMGKHFDWTFDEGTQAFRSERNAAAVAAAARLDGLYVIRTRLTRKELDDAAVIAAYQSLARVERACRSLRTMVLPVRPIFHGKECRVRAHVFQLSAGVLLGVAFAAALGASALCGGGRPGADAGVGRSGGPGAAA